MYYNEKISNLDFDNAVAATIKSLQDAGFGVLSDIDLAGKLKEKTGQTIEPYKILGACHPPSALKAVKAEEHIGLMLPCNVIVYRSGGKTHIASIKPSAMMNQIKNPSLDAVACEVESKLKAAIEKVS